MKSIIILLLVFCLFPTMAFGAPFLICDPQIGVAWYDVQNLGSLTNSSVPAQSDGSIKLDIAILPPGIYSTLVRACNQRGCSDASNFTFTKSATPTKPTNVRILFE
jgi:hypothetical protein